MEILGYCCALIIGTIMGLTGAGGAILTVPVLVYLVGIEPVMATAYSLFIVGTTASFGSAQNLRKGLVSVKTGLTFAVPSLIGVFLSRRFILPSVPEVLFTISGVGFTRGTMIMIVFSAIMALSALSMLRRKKIVASDPIQPAMLALRMFAAGLLVGMVGAGGGFMFVPLLVIVAKLPMKQAAATSLFIMAINSLSGFAGDLGNIAMDWQFLLTFAVIAIAGVFTGIHFSKKVDEQKLKKGFGILVLTMAIVIFTSEVLA